MKFKLLYTFLVLVLLASCKDDSEKRRLENEKQQKKNELIFSKVSNAWDFYDEPINETSENLVSDWTEFRSLLNELRLKPKKTIGAFQQKATAISKKAAAMDDNIPEKFNQPQIKSRIATMTTKVRLLDLYIHLDLIPAEKVVKIISEINNELASLQRQMDKIEVRSTIPVEIGESELKQMLDASRAIPNEPIDPNLPRVE
ncbi:hypothetical protein [Flavobacterium frigidarium]|uniref:hypothetical protein n=1 Tax=Flavobacterium frigidarium TaxID=99286 RepID=UPI0030D9E401|tara:strand:+ start:1510 stop:2112 length:603 start_codon:yes stop_codon:yes gene_type:complete